MWKLSFDHSTYIRLTKISSNTAAKYRTDCGLDIVKKTIEVKGISPVVEVKKTEEITIDREQMKELLTNAEVEFKGNASNVTLLELIKENWLI